jgi:predicted HTH domain antitoxin
VVQPDALARAGEGMKQMSAAQVDLGEELAAVLRELDGPLERAARELIVLELYRRGTISSGKAAELLGMPRLAFIQHASRLGIPYFNMTEDEWKEELARLDQL